MFQVPVTYSDGYELSVDLKYAQNGGFMGVGLCNNVLHNGSDNFSSYNNVQFGIYPNEGATFSKSVNGNWQMINRDSNVRATSNHYYTFKFKVVENTVYCSVYDDTTLLYSYNASYTHTINPKYYCLIVWGGNNPFNGAFKNVKIMSL